MWNRNPTEGNVRRNLEMMNVKNYLEEQRVREHLSSVSKIAVFVFLCFFFIAALCPRREMFFVLVYIALKVVVQVGNIGERWHLQKDYFGGLAFTLGRHKNHASIMDVSKVHTSRLLCGRSCHKG